MKANVVGVLWFLCPRGTAMDIRVQEISTGYSTLAAQLGIPVDKVRLPSVAGGGNYGRPLNNCEEGCACNTDSAIVIHDSEGRVMWAVCANGCELSSSCPSYHSLMVRCAPLGRCFIRCIFTERDCPAGSACAAVQLGSFEDRICMYYMKLCMTQIKYSASLPCMILSGVFIAIKVVVLLSVELLS